MEPNALFENGAAADEAAPPNAELTGEAPKGLYAEPTPVPNTLLDVESNGELVGVLAGAVGNPPPPNADVVLDKGTVVADDDVDTDALLDLVVWLGYELRANGSSS